MANGKILNDVDLITNFFLFNNLKLLKNLGLLNNKKKCEEQKNKNLTITRFVCFVRYWAFIIANNIKI